ncbi:MAG: response regulator transcription factor [Hyphomicrobiaceae bacterium]
MTADAPEAIPVVFIIDDDASVRESLTELFTSVGLQVAAFGSPVEFLRNRATDAAGCLVLDVRLPGSSGLDFQAELARADIQLPIIFITGHGDIPMTVRAMKAGAMEFLTKPIRDQDLLDAVQRGIDLDRTRREQNRSVTELRARLALLTPREREVVTLVSAGLLNKQIAGRLGVAEITIKMHRGNAMRKLQAASLADLMRIVRVLGLQPPG